jgi:hypothetical protein
MSGQEELRDDTPAETDTPREDPPVSDPDEEDIDTEVERPVRA